MKRHRPIVITSIALILLIFFCVTPCLPQEEEEVRLSLERCIELTLENNLDIAAQRINPEISQLNYEIAQSIFDPTLSASSSRNVSNREATSFISITKSETDSHSLSLDGSIVTGGSYSVSIDASKNLLTAAFPLVLNPSYSTGLNFSFNQPFLRNFGREVTKYSIYLAKNNYAISDSQFRQMVISTIEEVETAYWNLVGAIDQLKVQRESLKLAEDQLERNKIMVKVGTKAPIDVTEAEATVAERVVNVINTENTVKAAEDTLKRIINVYIAPDSPMWRTCIIPIDRPTFEKVSVDLKESMEKALEERPEIEEAELNLEILRLTTRYHRNQRLPQLDFQGNYGLSGTSGTINDPGPDGSYGTADDIIIVEGIGKAFDDIRDRNYTDWRLGINFSIPIRNRSAAKQYIISKLEYDQANLNYKNIKNSIALDVKDAVRNIEMSLKRLDATKASRILSKERLDAIQKKFENGMATNFEVSEYQQAMAAAESEEINALIEYNVSLLSLEKAQGSLLQSRGIILEETEHEIY